MSSSRKNLPNVRRYVPRVEGLEDRTVPAGNVQVMLFDGTLYVAGDDLGNEIEITGNDDGGASVVGRNGTTVNGGTGPVVIDEIDNDLYVRLHGGDDIVTVIGMQHDGTINVGTGDGNDILGVSGAGQRGATILSTGAGDDIAILHGSVLRKYSSVDTGAGDDQVIVDRIGAINIRLINPAGNDFLDNRGATLVRPTIIGFTNGTRPVVVPPVPPVVDGTGPATTLSTTAPNPTRTSPIALAVNFDEDVTGFTASDLIVTNGTVTGFTAVNARTFTVQVTPAGQGTVTVVVPTGAATDAAGNASLSSNTVTLTFDNVAPAITTNALTTSDTTPTLTGTVDDPNATVQVTVNSQTYTATVTGNTWTADVTNALADGGFAISATATDAVGNVGTAALATVVVSLFDLAAASDSGAVGDLRTDASTVTLTGTTTAGAIVRLYTVVAPGTPPGTGTPLAQTTAAPDGTYSFLNVVLNVGPNSFAVTSEVASVVGAPLSKTFTRNTAPTVTTAIGPQTATAGGADLTFDLTTTFADAERVARLTTAYPTGRTGSIDVHLFAPQAGATVTNFLSYNYDGSVFHRLAPNFVLQGGGFRFVDSGTTTATAFPPIADQAPINNQPSVSNTRGTISMAKVGGDPNSATNEFFFNLADNSAGGSSLDSQNGGFTVFGQVMNGGQRVVDEIGGLATFSGAGIPGAAPFPVRSGADTTNFPANITAADVALVNTVRELGAAERMIFTASSSNAAVATATVTGGSLTIDPLTTGSTIITVQATDLDGSVTQIQFLVTVA